MVLTMMRFIVVGVVVLGSVVEAQAEPYNNAGYFNAGYFNAGYFNNKFFNAGYFNTSYLNGATVNGLSFVKMKKSGQQIDNVQLVGTNLRGYAYVYENGSWTYRLLAPTEFAQVTFDVAGVDSTNAVGAVAKARIDSITVGPETTTYRLSLSVGVAGPEATIIYTWQPLCGCEPGTGTPGGRPCSAVPAVPIVGAWNMTSGTLYGGARISSSQNQVTWACTNAAVGKCAAGKDVVRGMGYQPSRTETRWVYDANAKGGWRTEETDGKTSHQTCTRMVRADYCGDGTPHTVTGRPIEIWDNLPAVSTVNTRTGGEGYMMEAEWAADGARWVDACRMPSEWMPACPTYTTWSYDLGSNTVVQGSHTHHFDLNNQCGLAGSVVQGGKNSIMNMTDWTFQDSNRAY